MWLWSALAVVVISAASQLLFLFPFSQSASRLVPSEGVIVISSSSGGGRELAFTLADAGFQVIVGVSSNSEKRSYRYSSRKGNCSLICSISCPHSTPGVEPMVLDLNEPGQLALLHYRLEELSMKHSRNLMGIVLISEDTRKGKPVVGIDRHELNAGYRDRVEGPIRLAQVRTDDIIFWLTCAGLRSFLQPLRGQSRLCEVSASQTLPRSVGFLYESHTLTRPRHSPWGCGASCSFASTDVDILRHHFSRKLSAESAE
jgi:hypothetical protein